MAGDDPDTPPSRRRHRASSPDAAADDNPSSKRRKHRHHHHHRRRRHHHRETDDSETAAVAAPLAVLVPAAEDDREEGEIFEEEDGGGFANGGKGAGSDVESGEIKPEASNLGNSCEENIFSDKDLKTVKANGNELFDKKIGGSARNSVNYGVVDRSSEISSGDSDGDLIFGKPAVKKGENQEMVSEGESNREISVPMIDGDLASGKKKQQHEGYEKLKTQAMKQKNREDSDTEASNHNLERHNSKPRFELEGTNEKSSSKSNRSLSPDHLRDMHRGSRHRSPSYGRHRDEGHPRKRSRSRDKEQSSEHVSVRNISDHGRDARYDRVDQYTAKSRVNDVEVNTVQRERESSVFSKHDRREDRLDREREIHREDNRERKRSHSHSRYEDRDARHGTRDSERDMERGLTMERDRRERDRSTSISSRHDRLDDRHGSRDIGRDRERDRGREKPRDISRDSYRERDRVRDGNRERERNIDGYDRDRDRARDRDMRMEKDREFRQVERDRVSHRDKQRDSRHSRYDERGHHREASRSRDFLKETSSTRHDPQEEKAASLREENEEDYQEKIEQQLSIQDEEDPEKIKEESRKRRQAILEKYKQRQTQQNTESPDNGHEGEDKSHLENGKIQELIPGGPVTAEDTSNVYAADPSFTVGKSPMQQNKTSTPERRTGTKGLGEGTPKSERSADMFSDDIFGESPAAVRKGGKEDSLQIDRSGLHDNWDDAEGYYSYRLGEVLDGRYEVIAAHGKGVFSTVVRAKDLKAGMGDPEEVAIKIIRNNETMYKAGQEELIILKKLAGADPEDKRHCVRFLSSFKYRNHLCLVFESLHMNLREVLKKFGRNIGIRLTAVRAYAKQLFVALKHLKNCGVLHCDIKPDNMLVNEGKNVLKLCDFGNAMFSGKNEITPYLVSRFYRAPEIILGLPYDHPMDMWSVGCCLYELYSGKVLFPGPSNNDMLRLHMELKGPFPKKMLRKGAFIDQHFDQDLNFHATEEDPVTKKTVKRLLLNIKPKDISALISNSGGEDQKLLASFKDLLERIFVLDPEKRMTVAQALSHPFITGK